MEYKDRAQKEFEDMGNQFASLCSALEALKECWEKVDLLLENAVEIGQSAAFLERDGKIVVNDSKELAMSCVRLAKQFEEQFDPDVGDYYLEIEDFAQRKLIEEFRARPNASYDVDTYKNSMHKICYIPENAQSEADEYSHSRLLALVHGDEDLCDELFDHLEWEFPETFIKENLEEGIWGKCKACGRYYRTGDEDGNRIKECPCCYTPLSPIIPTPGDVHYDVAVDRELGYEKGE